MHQVTAEYAKNNFNEVIELASTEPGGVVITQEDKKMVLISQEELDAWIETASLLQDPELLTDVTEAKEQYQKGDVLTMEQIFG
ncbi:MAG: type II toxin-antitoxin system Phd/YefM family antitoxin [Kastovskya adunca ATA6-11-RM4]|jgi:prevent-host-death family protein|nr:type II toxin-antitoxin system Phd/YefM family antitoxin [Kastovskya adunca ATA6-11-RM4]